MSTGEVLDKINSNQIFTWLGSILQAVLQIFWLFKALVYEFFGQHGISSYQGASQFECTSVSCLEEKSALSLVQKNGLQAAPLAGCGYTNIHQNSFFPFPLPTVTVNSWLYSFFCPHSWKLKLWTRMAKSSMAQSAWRSLSSTRTTTDPCSKRGPTWVMSWRDLPQVSPCHSQLSNTRQILLWWGRYYHIVQIFLLMLWFAGSVVHKKEWEQHSFGKTGNGFWKTSLQLKKKKKKN